ncbi:MAG: DUF366 family protein [bacterium]
MKSIWIDDEITYDGTQLSSHWIHAKCGVLGDSIACFMGPADVPLEKMVDLVDVAQRSPIYSKRMLHFIIEHFDADLALTIARQRLLTAISADELRARTKGAAIERRGDDIYEGDLKISVSIATASPVSCLIHFAMNVESVGTPVPTRGLADYGIEPKPLADAIVRQYCEEIASMSLARCKVRAVK